MSNHPEIRKTDTEASKTCGMGTPMGSRMMSGNTKYTPVGGTFDIKESILKTVDDIPKNKFFTEEPTEYYPPNINNFPKHKKFMEKWVKLSAKRHRLFENGVRAKERHKLDFSEYGVEEVFEETQTTLTSSSTT